LVIKKTFFWIEDFSARDQSIRMYDLRMVKEIQAFTGIDSEVEGVLADRVEVSNIV